MTKMTVRTMMRWIADGCRMNGDDADGDVEDAIVMVVVAVVMAMAMAMGMIRAYVCTCMYT